MAEFKREYQKIYDGIRPSQELEKMVLRLAGEGELRARRGYVLFRAAAMAATIICCLCVAVPVSAAHISGIYRVLDRISPSLADLLVPVEVSSTKKGITMTVEGVSVEGKNASVLVSFADEEGSGERLIHGPVDLYDSYELRSHKVSGIISGCRFLEYDETSGKAYFEVQTEADSKFQRDKLTFQVRELLCNKRKEEREILLEGVLSAPKVKTVTLNGRSGKISNAEGAELPVEKDADGKSLDLRPDCQVMDFGEVGQYASDSITVTGIGYVDGILRVQMCMGDTTHADRHVELMLENHGESVDSLGMMWHEEAGNRRYQFYENWYAVEEEDLGACVLSGVFCEADQPVEGNWKVTFKVE